MSKKEILIVGAGPSGLSMGIFLHQLGYHPRIIDRKQKISNYSKALGVNPRSLEIFDSFGVTTKFLNNGRKMKAINIWKGDKHVLRNDFAKSKHKYPFMLIQPQKDSEEILLQELKERGISVEYDTEFLSMKTEVKQHKAIIQHQGNNSEVVYDYLIGADGGHSKVRDFSGVAYDGLRYDDEWELYDIELDMDINPNEGHIRFFPEGGLLMIRLEGNIWRIAGRMNDILQYLPKNTQTGAILWQSKFRIHHKIAQKLAWDNVGIIGDAAHLHSPVGARGMNLGVEDAYVLSKLIHTDTINDYNRIRKPYLNKTVKTINNVTMLLSGRTSMSKRVRKNIGILRYAAPLVMPKARKFVLGLN